MVTVDNGSIYLVISHDKGRTILVLGDDGAFRPYEAESAGALADLLEDVAEEYKMKREALRQAGGEPTEWSEVRTAPGNPRHVTEILNHIAHLDYGQEEELRNTLNRWKERS